MAIDISLPTVLTLTAAVLKLTGVVAWSWLLVASPVIADVLLAGVLLAVTVAYAKRNGVTLSDVKEYQAVVGKSKVR
jgi:flagellar biosynthesis protein FliQ